MTVATVRHLGCPSCGATLTRREDERTVRCRGCGNRSVLVGVEAEPRFQIVPRVDRSGALTIVRTKLAQWPVREGTAASAAVVAADLFWVPFYEFETLQAGTVRQTRGIGFVRGGRVDWSGGTRRFVDDSGLEISETTYYRRHETSAVDTKVVLRTHRAAGQAAGPDDWGLDAIDVARLQDDPEVRVVPFGSRDAPRGHVLPPRRGRAAAEDDVRRIAGIVGDAQMDALASEVRYVFVPVWVVRLRVDRHPYTFVVDGVRGTVLAGRAPEAPRRGALFVAFAAAYVGFPVGKLIAVTASSSGPAAGGAFGAAVGVVVQLPFLAFLLPILLLFPLAFAWGEFRFRGEVVFGPKGARIEKLARPARTTLERITDWLLAKMEEAIQAQGRFRGDEG